MLAIRRSYLPIMLLFASAVFSQNDMKAPCCPSSDCGLPVPNMCAYNAPAQVSPKCPWKIFGGASFIYWQAIEADLELADRLTITIGAPAQGQVEEFNFKYKPGFKLDFGVNFDYDNWDLFADYTWYHTGNMTTTATAPGLYNGGVPTGPLLSSRFQGTSAVATGFQALLNLASRTWNLKTDFLDLMLARSYYVGTKLKFRSSFGPRAAWIRQKMSANYIGNGSLTEVLGQFILGSTTISTNTTVSWGYGLKGAIESDWILGCGFKMFGYGSADLLYTRYNLLNKTTSNNNVELTSLAANSSEWHFGCVRPHVELDLGFAYETYFNCCKGYVDFAASYNFQVFWNQNMFLENTNSPLPTDELYLHGLTLTGTVAF